MSTNMPRTTLFVLILIFFLTGAFLNGSPVFAQNSPPSQPVYVVQSGDTLWEIAQRFRVSLDDLTQANPMANPGAIQAGDRLIIPGLEGVEGTLITIRTPYGETLRSLSRGFQVPEGVLMRLNHITSPQQVYAGFNLILPESDFTETTGRREILHQGQSLLEFAVLHGLNPYAVAQDNALDSVWQALPGDVLRIPGDEDGGPGSLPGEIASIEVNTADLVQGKTMVIKLAAKGKVSGSGVFLNHEMPLLEEADGSYVALQGIHALTPPGFYPLEITGELADGALFSASQMVYVRSAGYPQAPNLTVDPAGLDPAITMPEDNRWYALATPVSHQKYWDGYFQFPSPRIYLGQYTSRFGERRTYNQGPRIYFHTGLDIPGQTGTEVYSPASGTVVFAEHMDVRGNSVIIDHGWGVYSAYMHLSEFMVDAGDQVETGQVIALVGNTGLRTTGSHLHWEILVGGVQVDPLDWLDKIYP
jgi:murein DD-endopeptidase MepM/ murein hydrolase activator NlpD